MKITNDEAIRAASIDPISAPKLQPHTPRPTTTATPGAGPAAQVEISAQAKALGTAKTEAASYLPAVHAAPDIRTDLVSKLKTQVDSGTYRVSSADIADQIVRRAQADTIH